MLAQDCGFVLACNDVAIWPPIEIETSLEELIISPTAPLKRPKQLAWCVTICYIVQLFTHRHTDKRGDVGSTQFRPI